MAQKVIQIGKSAGIIIPKKYLEDIGWKLGDNVYFRLDTKGNELLITKNKSKEFRSFSKKDLELLRWTESFIERYRKDLEELAQK
jgi:bifunctional DNA-binding transcriptional regulator/antitoxin component of YhaV-PrlF toxin-antitoxin module